MIGYADPTGRRASGEDRLLANTTTWPAALGAYLAVKPAEDAYDRETYMPAFRGYEVAIEACGEGTVSAADYIATDIEAEIKRLRSARHEAEDAVMAIPSPNAAAFARKCPVARGENRGADGWDNLLEAEAKHFVEVGATDGQRYRRWVAGPWHHRSAS